MIAIGLNVLVSAIAMAIFFQRATVDIGFPADLQAAIRVIPPSVIAGMVGAYIWGLYEVLKRYQAADLSSISLHFVWLRMPISAALGYIFANTFQESVALLVALMVGALPIGDIVAYVSDRARKQLELGGGAAEGPTLHHLQGCTKEVIDRLRDEEIDSIERLAFADPIRLLLRTNFEWKVILDLIDQAALYNYVGEASTKLRPLGIRGAMEMVDVWEALGQPGSNQLDAPPPFLVDIAGKLDLDAFGTQNLLRTLAEDLHVQFLRKLWSEGGDEAEG